MISNQCRYDLYPNILYTTGPHIEHQQYSDPDDPTYEYCIYLKIEELHKTKRNNPETDAFAPFLHYPFWYGKDCAGLQTTLEQIYEELSHRLGLSTRQTSRILYDRYGKNFLQKRTEARMAAAVTFLKENKLTISEISARLGYSYPNHFHTAFKNYYHRTISDYKEQVLKSSRRR